jgi:hypothetical protein
VTPDGGTVRYTALVMGNVTISASTATGADFGFSGNLTIDRLAYNDADTGFDRLDWTTAFDLDADGTPDVLDPGALLPTPADLAIDLPGTLEFRVSGSIEGTGQVGVIDTTDDSEPDVELFAAGPISIRGTAEFALSRSRSTTDVDEDGDGTPDLLGATLDSVALTVSGVEVDVSGVANLTVSGELGLARVTPDGQPVRYTALTMGNVTITGSVTLAIDLTAELTVNKLQYNHAEGAYDPLDWTTAFDLDGDGTPDLLDPGALLPTPVDLTIDFGSSLEVKVSGTLSGNGGSGDRILEIAGVSLSGSVSFTLSLQTVDIQDPLGDPKVGVQLTTLAFGINSPLTLAVDSISASITAGGLAIATIKLADNTEYFGLRGENLAATITGVPGLEGALTDVTIKINKATDGTGMPTTALNWQTSVDLDSDGAFDAGSVGIVDPGLDLVPPRSLPIDFTTELVSFAAIVDIDLFGIIQISASFAVNATITDVDTDGDSGLDIDDADLTTYAVSVDPFADRVQSVTIQVEGIGVRITAGDVVIAVVEAADGRAFFAVRADNIEAELIGLPDAIRLDHGTRFRRRARVRRRRGSWPESPGSEAPADHLNDRAAPDRRRWCTRYRPGQCRRSHPRWRPDTGSRHGGRHDRKRNTGHADGCEGDRFQRDGRCVVRGRRGGTERNP